MPPKEQQTDSNTVTELFFALLRCGIGVDGKLPYAPSPEQWEQLLDICEKQAVIGIAYKGITSLPKEQRPPKNTLVTFFQASETIKENNIRQNKIARVVADKFKHDGFRCCILKGQGIAQLYPDPYMRTCGDTDIWLDGDTGTILNYIRKYFPKCRPTYHHVDFPIKKGVEIEVHFTPSWMHSPLKNSRLQKFFTKQSPIQFSNITESAEGSFPSPTLAFNRIYILLHIYRHLFQEGIGLRQLLDYHFVLDKGFTPTEKEDTLKTIDKLGLTRFCAAVMYLLQNRFGLKEEKLLLPPDRKAGEFLLGEIMQAGNFGMYDSRYAIVSNKAEFRHFLNSMQRISRLTFHYPSETFWSPYFKMWHFFWRKRHAPKC